MAEEPELTPEQITAAARLAHFKQVTLERIVSHMNGVGASIVNAYPMAEVQSWTIQKQEADAIIAQGETSVSGYPVSVLQENCPFLLAVCVSQHGPVETDSDRAVQVWQKAEVVKANADLWAGLSAFVNGLRARAKDLIAAATDEAEVFEIESSTQTELSAFRDQYGV